MSDWGTVCGVLNRLQRKLLQLVQISIVSPVGKAIIYYVTVPVCTICTALGPAYKCLSTSISAFVNAVQFIYILQLTFITHVGWA